MSIDAGAKGYSDVVKSDVVKVLLDGGGANAGDSEGRTVLKITLESEYTRVAEILREAGARESEIKRSC